jgi:hypothetical protein
MAGSSQASITLPLETLSQAQDLSSRQNRSVQEIISSAVDHLAHEQQTWDKLMAWGETHARQLCPHSDAEVQSLCAEWKQTRRQSLSA